MRYIGIVALVLIPLSGCASQPKSNADAARNHGSGKVPDGSNLVAGTETLDLSPGFLEPQGSCELWVRLDEPMINVKRKITLIDSDTWELFLDARGSELFVLWHVIGPMNGKDDKGKQHLYWLAANMRYLNADQWYHIALSWDAGNADNNGIFVDGIRQVGGSPYGYEGQLKPLTVATTFTLGAPGVTMSRPRFADEPVDEEQLRHEMRQIGHKGYTDEGARFDGRPFMPKDVDWGHPIYATEFDDPDELADWVLEGGFARRIDDGCLILENGASGESGGHLVCWLKQEMPADYLLEFTVNVKDRRCGLNIVFLNARGLNGDSIFDPALEPRDGTFRQYHSGDLNNYHISYWSGTRSTANLRKNKGFHLGAVGRDLVWTAEQDTFQTVRIYKRGGTIRVTVDDILCLSYDDDGKAFGPVHTHGGWIGLRQMGHTGWGTYGRLAVYPLKK